MKKADIMVGILIICVSVSMFIMTQKYVGKVYTGYLMRYYGYPLAPVMIALILGPIAEQNFCRSLMVSHGSFAIFFKSPIFDAFLALAIISLGFALYQHKKIMTNETIDNERKYQ